MERWPFLTRTRSRDAQAGAAARASAAPPELPGVAAMVALDIDFLPSSSVGDRPRCRRGSLTGGLGCRRRREAVGLRLEHPPAHHVAGKLTKQVHAEPVLPDRVLALLPHPRRVL